MIKELLQKIATVTNNYTTINVEFAINSHVYGAPKENVRIPTVKWELYIQDITNRISNIPDFYTFEQLESYVNILLLELKRVNQSAVKNAVEIAVELFKKDQLIKEGITDGQEK